MKKDSGSLKMGAERTRSGFNARCLWSWLLADEDEQCGQPDASDVRRHPWKEAASFAAAAALVVAFFWYSLAQIDYRPDFSFLPDFRVLLLRDLSSLYVVFIRGTPLIMQIYLFFYLVGTAWGVDDRFWAGVIILSVFEGAYISEIIRGSYLSIDPAQIESAKAVGFTRLQQLRFVIVPQMAARTLPALAGQFASVIKDSSLLSMISVVELTQAMREVSAVNLKLVECYLFLGVLYLILTLPVALVSRLLEKRFRYEG